MNIFGNEPKTLTAFEDKGGDGADFRLAEHVGKGLIITVLGTKQVKTQNYGEKTAVNVDVVVLDAEPVEFKDALIFNAAPVDQLKGYAGQTIVADVVTYTAKSGTQAPKFDAPSEETQKRAEAYSAA